MEIQNYPKVRFEQFNDNWHDLRLKDFGESFSGTAIESEFVKKGKYKVISIGSYSLDSTYTDQALRVNYTEKTKDRILGLNDLAMVLNDKTLSGEIIGRTLLIEENDAYVFNQRTQRIILNQNLLDPFFIYQLLNANFIRSKVIKLAQGNTQIYVNWSTVKNIEYAIPSKEEQKHISQFFQNLDQSIALHEKKLAQTQNFKKAMLEKMFPKQGSLCPEIRLKGFSGDWEAFNLGSLCHIGDIDHRMPDSREQGIPYLMTGDFIGINELDFRNAKRISNEDYEQLAKKIKPEAGDILFARYASVGTVRYVKTHLKFLISYSCAILKTSVNSNGEYLFYYLQTKCSQNQIEQEINTGSQRNIGIDSLKKLSILMPKDDEQRAIADFFRKIDKNLVLQEKPLQTLKNLKQALLEKMFV